MAEILASADERVVRIKKWLGLNENPDGDTQLKIGEAAEMRNFKISRDGNLQKRDGMRTIHETRAWTGPVRGIWHGFVNSVEYTVFAAGGNIWIFDFTTNTATSILKTGATFTDAETSFFGYSEKLYIMNGHQYFEWDGTLPAGGSAAPVIGYRPLVAVQVPPAGGGKQLEQINKLNGLRRVRFSPNGSATTFQLPETGLTSVDYVKYTATGAAITYTANTATGVVTISPAPATGVDTIEVGYTHPVTFRATVEAMRFAEIYNGSTDNRVFIYGDGSNEAFYSGLDYDGQERADYFPDMNELAVGTANTPVTALIRHYSTLVCFKSDSTYAARYGTISLEDGSTTAAFYVTPVNRSIGNSAYGQAQLVLNSPRTLFNAAVYEWRNNASYSSNLSVDERQGKLVSDRVHSTLGSFHLASAYTFDDNERQEYYIIQNGKAVIHNYAVDVWYVYTGFNVTRLIAINGALYGCTSTGDIVHVSRAYANDNGAAIDAFWRSGSMAFDREWQRKYASKIFITMKPEPKASVNVTVRTNVKGDYITKTVSYGLSTFSDANFAHWSFGTSRQPQTARVKIKAKKFVYYQLVFESDNNWSAATILSAEIKVRYNGDEK
jgi:hypothetical protein